MSLPNGYVPPNAGEIVENPKTRKIIYKVVGYIGLVLACVTVALVPLGYIVEASPALLAAWSVFGVIQKWSSHVSDRNVILPPKLGNPVG